MRGGGGTQWGTDHRDQYIISYKLNSTWIDPEGVCDRLRSADGCTVNPTDQRGGGVLGWAVGGLRGGRRPQPSPPPHQGGGGGGGAVKRQGWM